MDFWTASVLHIILFALLFSLSVKRLKLGLKAFQLIVLTEFDKLIILHHSLAQWETGNGDARLGTGRGVNSMVTKCV